MSRNRNRKNKNESAHHKQANSQEQIPLTQEQPQETGNYTINRASRKLNLHRMTLERAINNGLLTATASGDLILIPSEEIDKLATNIGLFESIADTERIKIRDIADAMGVQMGTARKRLQQAGIDPNKPQWGQIRGQWDLPTHLSGFWQQLQANRDIQKLERREKREAVKQKRETKKEAERRQRAELRAQLVASFPAWSESDRSDQVMMLHVGPPNSGKTHDALLRLSEAGEGWYLAPLRLLAWEVFERLNQRGVPCNLLTGEEFVPVEGATITAATVEMFNPNASGKVVVIDEAQMLADADRGWAWTSAMMTARAPEIHIIAPQTAQDLITRMANAANMSIGTVVHERLAPIKIADKAWNLRTLPARTILVAFSRKMVLSLKTRLEMMGRSVSVVYGSLPPEVRRRQAERFANGETEICVATDAVGMGLNLPADYVCFYEVEKFDGRDMRNLTPAEVQQIGGRAGRYGFSQAGEIGATRKNDLRLIRDLFYLPAEELTHARVAPSVTDLAMIPGNLAQKLREWSRLQSIPYELRTAVKTADMTERIELASKLSDSQVARLGLEYAVQLVNAPTRKSTRDFWYDCAVAIIDQTPMPLPPAPPEEIIISEDLDYTETCISTADIYLWLSQRREFNAFAEHAAQVRQERQEWSDRIDSALLSRMKTDYLSSEYKY